MTFGLQAAVLLCEKLTPATVSTSLFYMLACACSAWCVGLTGGLLVGFATVSAGAIIKHSQLVALHLHALGPAAELWNTLARFLTVAILAMVVNGLRSALALERWRASRDGLTGLLNKAAFERMMAQAIVDAKARGRALVLAYMDLDGFKGVNDRFGHAVGDDVLRTFATAAVGVVRRGDLFARLGGDEFVALLSVRSCEEGDQVATMLHSRLTSILVDTRLGVTCSMGALVADAAGMESKGGLLRMADALMYEVKRSGKNALRIARGGGVGEALRAAYAPIDTSDELALLLKRIDADGIERSSDSERRAA
ncbi:GGDEF domain-containing protein [Sphingomonas nostoxanthinifaciens]|uniref:GGDEF domain-containing protein n=1 Tax=Sphingomonas nostoxanthinifaciens TaxID=2872652 RepID=UPI001CC1DDB8|nr:GGDEF domain-containing protein [Sphingomonas nostoxanthinifaciens]UAK24148.1 GGDEF domain-containing protein [Sphingomonas nostoxanthinifaciens]